MISGLPFLALHGSVKFALDHTRKFLLKVSPAMADVSPFQARRQPTIESLVISAHAATATTPT
jgi:hypothetical protein